MTIKAFFPLTGVLSISGGSVLAKSYFDFTTWKVNLETEIKKIEWEIKEIQKKIDANNKEIENLTEIENSYKKTFQKNEALVNFYNSEGLKMQKNIFDNYANHESMTKLMNFKKKEKQLNDWLTNNKNILENVFVAIDVLIKTADKNESVYKNNLAKLNSLQQKNNNSSNQACEENADSLDSTQLSCFVKKLNTFYISKFEKKNINKLKLIMQDTKDKIKEFENNFHIAKAEIEEFKAKCEKAFKDFQLNKKLYELSIESRHDEENKVKIENNKIEEIRKINEDLYKQKQSKENIIKQEKLKIKLSFNKWVKK